MEAAQEVIANMRELVPADESSGEGSAVYEILHRQYTERLNEKVAEMNRVLAQLGELSTVGLEWVVKLCGVGQCVESAGLKGELWTRVIIEYRKNAEIKNRELRKQIQEKRKQRQALARAIRASERSSPSFS